MPVNGIGGDIEGNSYFMQNDKAETRGFHPYSGNGTGEGNRRIFAIIFMALV